MRNPQPELERSSTLRQVEAVDAMLTEPDNGAPPQSIRPLSSEEARTVLSQYNPVFEETQVRFAFRAVLVTHRPRPDITRGLSYLSERWQKPRGRSRGQLVWVSHKTVQLD